MKSISLKPCKKRKNKKINSLSDVKTKQNYHNCESFLEF